MLNDNIFTAFFVDTSTAPGTVLTGLSATITIRETLSPYTVVVNDQAMTEVGGGHYIYVFSGYENGKEYMYTCDPNSSSSYIQSGVTNKRFDYLDKGLSEILGGGVRVNMAGITGMLDKIEKRLKALEDKDDSIDLNPILDIVKSEIQSIEKYDDKDIRSGLSEIVNNISKIDKRLIKYIKEDKDSNDIKDKKEEEKESKFETMMIQQTNDIIEGIVEGNKKIEEEKKLMHEIMVEIMKQEEEERNMSKEIVQKEMEDNFNKMREELNLKVNSL